MAEASYFCSVGSSPGRSAFHNHNCVRDSRVNFLEYSTLFKYSWVGPDFGRITDRPTVQDMFIVSCPNVFCSLKIVHLLFDYFSLFCLLVLLLSSRTKNGHKKLYQMSEHFI